MLGFTPVNSVVVIGLTAAGAMAPVIRADAADFSVEDSARNIAVITARHLSRAGAKRAIIVGFGQHMRLGCAETVVAARRALAEHIDVVDAWAVANGRYRSPECVDSRCCPDAGRAVPAPPAQIAQGVHRATPRRRRALPGARRTAAAKRNARMTARWTSRPKDVVAWRQRRLEAWRSALRDAADGVEPTDADIGKLVAGLEDVCVRDAIVVDLVPGEGDVAEALCVDASAPGVREALAVMLVPTSAVAPPIATVEGLERLVNHIAWLCPRHVAPAMTVLGLLRWWHGDESGAARAISVALSSDPHYRLAELVQCAIDAHLPPGWLTAA